MPNKALRILIADEHLVQLMQVEKMLNQMGYYRIAPVQSFNELLALTQCALEPFDLLIANIDLANREGVDLVRFCKSCPQIQHALLYESHTVPLPAVSAGQNNAVSVCLSQPPDSEVLKTFMTIVDAPKVLAELSREPNSQRAHQKRRMSYTETVFSRHS